MTTWCREYDFSQIKGEWQILDEGTYTRNVGYTQTFLAAGQGYVACNITLEVPPTAVFTKIELEYSAVLGGIEGWPSNARNLQFRTNSNTANDQLGSIVQNPNGSHSLHVREGEITNINKLLCVCTVGYSASNHDMGGTITYHRITLHGTGDNPFTLNEMEHEAALNTAFTALQGALQADPDADISTEIGAYRDAIQDAFGVTFDGEPTAPDTDQWSAVSLHFARQGLQKTAEAFKTWVEAQVDNPCIPVDRYALFRRIMGSITFKNKAQARTNFAQSNQALIEVFQRPKLINYYVKVIEGEKQYTASILVDGTPIPPPSGEYSTENLPQFNSNQFGIGEIVGNGRQAKMSPNNLIHEMGHSISRFAGFTTAAERGTIEYAIVEAGDPYTQLTRKGMGELFLQQYLKDNPNAEYYEHAQVNNSSGAAQIVPNGLLPSITTQKEKEQYYLLYDLLKEDHYALWNNPIYNPYIFNVPKVRIDFHVHNADASTLETAADAFLNWVLGKLNKLDSTDPDWQSFFDVNMGIFLRNAVLFNQGSVEHFQFKEYIPNTSIATGYVASDYRLRITPDETTDLNVFGYASEAEIGLYQQTAHIYGWTDRIQTSETSTKWLLVADMHNRLLWIAEGAIPTITGSLTTANKVDPSLFYLGNAYVIDDIRTITGV